MASGQDSSGTTLMDLITSDPSAAPASGASAQQSSSGGGSLGRPAVASADRKSKKSTLMQIQNETISAAKALNPVKALPQRNRKKKPVSYAQLARSIHELAATCDQKSSQRQLVNSVFPKLAVYNSVDPSVAPSLLMQFIEHSDADPMELMNSIPDCKFANFATRSTNSASILELSPRCLRKGIQTAGHCR